MGQISKYAGSKSSEGFAEFHRMVRDKDVDMKRVERELPKCYKFWKDHGLL